MTFSLHSALVWIAGASTLFFVLKLALLWVGGDGDWGEEISTDGSIDPGLRMLTTLGLTAFGMGFSWLALALEAREGVSRGMAIGLGGLNGLALMVLTAAVLRGLAGLSSPGRENRPVLGQRGQVLTRLAAAGGVGLVRLIDVETRQARDVRAVVAGAEELIAGVQVEVVSVDGDLVHVRAAGAGVGAKTEGST